VAPLAAQSPRLAVSLEAGEFRPRGGSEAYALFDRALAPGAKALRPTLVGGALHVRVTPRWRLALGGERGSTTAASVGRTRPASAGGEVRQHTSLDLTSVWRAAAEDRARLVLGAGAGSAHYRLRQWGEFVDEARQVTYPDELRSAGRGAFGYASAAAEVSVRRWLTLSAQARRHAGSASMSGDFAGFDRLDLGGIRLGVGLRVGT
jgi:hypothetical protein